MRLFRPPAQFAPEFEVEKCVISSGKSASFPALESCSVILIISGNCTIKSLMKGFIEAPEVVDHIPNAPSGTVVFVSAGESLEAVAETDVEFYRAHINFAFT